MHRERQPGERRGRNERRRRPRPAPTQRRPKTQTDRRQSNGMHVGLRRVIPWHARHGEHQRGTGAEERFDGQFDHAAGERRCRRRQPDGRE